MSIPAIKTILYATAMGPYSRRVFQHALLLAHQFNAHLVMLHVIEPVGEMGDALIRQYLPDDMVSRIHDEGIKSILEKMQKRVSQFYEEEIDRLGEDFRLPIEPVAVEGVHADSILQQAEQQKADMIVVGSEVGHGLKRRNYTTRQVVKHAKVPVVVVPTGKDFY